MKKQILKMLFTSALFFLGVIACKHDVFNEGDSILNSQDCSYSVQYDAEINQTFQPVNSADMNRLTPQDRVGLMPHSSRNVVDFCLKKDGTSEWFIEKKQPSQVFEAKSYTLPDPSPKTKKIHIKNDKAYLMDADGKVFKETDFKVDFLIAGLKEVIRLATNNNPSNDYDKMMDDERRKGAVITDLGSGLYNMTKPLPTTSDKMTITFSKTMGRLIGNAVNDASGKLKYAVFYTYEQGVSPSLKSIIQRGYKTTPSGIDMVSQKIIQFNTLKIMGSLKDDNVNKY